MQNQKIHLNMIRCFAEKKLILWSFERIMNYLETIRHEGIVEHIEAGSCRVRILQASACSSCSARQLCRSSEAKEKIIEVRGHFPSLQVGDAVTLSGSVRQGLWASVLAYIVPLILVVATLFISSRYYGERMGALAALLVLAMYYVVLYLLREKLGKHFSFEIVNSN